DLLGKRRSFSPNSSSDCPSESKKSRSVSPKGRTTAVLPVVEAGGSVGHMSPEDHYRRMMFSLSEQGSYEEQQQRLYQLASSMGLPGHDLLRARQEALVAAVRSPALEAHLPSGSSSSSSQRRKQGLPQHRDAHEHTTFCFRRDLSQPPPLLSPPTAPHITLGPHLRPPFLGMPTALCQAPGFGFLPPAQAEIFARQQEMLRKQNLARLEMSAELLRQKELENLRQQPLPADHPALRNIQDLPEGHPLREELARRASAMLVLRHGATPPLLSLNQPQSGTSTPKDPHGHSSATGSDSRKCPSGGSGGPPGRQVPPSTRLHAPAACTPPYANPYFHSGAMGGLFTDGEDSSTANPAEDISKWSVEDVCGFISSLAGCAEYTQVFREQAIDGETLPLLTEGHLLHSMGLKLGPALKIRSQVARRFGRLFYMTGFPFAFPFPPAILRPPERDLSTPDSSLSSSSPYSGPTPGGSSPKQQNGTSSSMATRFEAKTPS
uniref:SAM domain-containing protein n=1 Tax=Periophthalmus magnuspinnatus TaxID=409849 RepID=A0A3B4A3Y5_9GOBI